LTHDRATAHHGACSPKPPPRLSGPGRGQPTAPPAMWVSRSVCASSHTTCHSRRRTRPDTGGPSNGEPVPVRDGRSQLNGAPAPVPDDSDPALVTDHDNRLVPCAVDGDDSAEVQALGLQPWPRGKGSAARAVGPFPAGGATRLGRRGSSTAGLPLESRPASSAAVAPRRRVSSSPRGRATRKLARSCSQRAVAGRRTARRGASSCRRCPASSWGRPGG
jgi:hypothetical protein